MQLKIKRFMSDPEEINFSDYVRQVLSGEDPERGELETIKASLGNISRTISLLLESLVEKKIISEEDGFIIADGWWTLGMDKIIK